MATGLSFILSRQGSAFSRAAAMTGRIGFLISPEAAWALGPATMIIDGEVVVLDDEGRPDFGLLQKSLGASGKTAGNRASDAILYAFDLIYLDGHDLRGVEYRSRRHLLEDTTKANDGTVLFVCRKHSTPNPMSCWSMSAALVWKASSANNSISPIAPAAPATG